MRYFLDSSALLAWFFDEPGAQEVERLLMDSGAELGLSVLTGPEFWASLRALGKEAAFETEWSKVLELFEELTEVGTAVTHKSIEIRLAVPGRLPTVDALIAASAAIAGAVLVHRDPHLATIPTSQVEQMVLPER